MRAVTVRRLSVVVIVMVALAGCTSAWAPSHGAVTVDPAKAEVARGLVETAMEQLHLRSAIVRVSDDGRNLLSDAWGVSLSGQAATTDMHLRNGAVAISYMSTLLLRLCEQGKVALDDRLSTWLPNFAHADEVTLGELASMTSGYHDYVLDPDFIEAVYADPFRAWTPEQLLAFVDAEPLWYKPGSNWSYAHTNYVLLGLALEKATGRSIPDLLQENVLGPLGLENTADPGSPALPEPVLHAYTGERHLDLGVPAGTAFYEESTFWSPSWTLTRGAIQYTDIYDMDRSAIAIGTGELLSPESYQTMVSTRQRDFGGPVQGCDSCRRGNLQYTYGMGIVIKGDWLLQNQMFSGYAAVMS